MRLFLAVNINQHSKNLIKKKVEILKKEYNNEIKWVREENWHLTLKFIGEASAAEKASLVRALKKIDFTEQNKYIQFAELAAFPDLKSAKVIYLALKQGKNLLEGLHDKLETELLKYGFNRDQRAYIPHLTLGRCNSPVKMQKIFQGQYFVNIYARIESISLYQSRLKAAGPEYIELFSIK